MTHCPTPKEDGRPRQWEGIWFSFLEILLRTTLSSLMSKNIGRFSAWTPQVRPKSAMRLRPYMRPSLLREFPSSAGNRHVTKAGHPKQYLTHTHNHLSWAVAAMDSCLAQISAHLHGTANHTHPCTVKAEFRSTLPGRVQSKDGLYFTDETQISRQRGLIVPRNATRLSLAIHCFGTGVLIWRLVAQQSRKTTF